MELTPFPRSSEIAKLVSKRVMFLAHSLTRSSPNGPILWDLRDLPEAILQTTSLLIAVVEHALSTISANSTSRSDITSSSPAVDSTELSRRVPFPA